MKINESARRLATPSALAAFSVALSAPFLALGPGWLLDDWWTLRNAELDVWWNAAGTDQWWVRPGAAAIYALFFGVLQSPTLVFVCIAALNAVLAAQIFRLFVLFVPAGASALVAAAWILLPNHTTMDYWASAANLIVAMILSLSGARRLACPDFRSHVIAGVLFAVSALFYEATLVLSGLAALTVPVMAGRPRDGRAVATGLLGCLSAALWIVLNWHPEKEVAGLQDFTPLFEAHFGWGVLPNGLAPFAAAAIFVFLAYAAGTYAGSLLGDQQLGRLAGKPERLGLLGMTLVLAGVVPFLRYGYQPLGLGDRANVVSSVGAACVWAAAFWRLWLWQRPAAVVSAFAVASLMLVVRYERAEIYARSADDAVAVLDALKERFPEPGTEVVVGPTPLICENIVGFFDEENVGPAYQLRMGSRRYWAVVSQTQEQFAREDGRPRLDQHDLRPDSSQCR